jgi:hypothetical protein
MPNNRLSRARRINDRDYFAVFHHGVNLKPQGYRMKALVRGQNFGAGKARVLSAAECAQIESAMRQQGRL